MTGVSVTPVVGYIGELTQVQLRPNYDEVERVFTVPLADLVDDKNWVLSENSTPIFTAGGKRILSVTHYVFTCHSLCILLSLTMNPVPIRAL